MDNYLPSEIARLILGYLQEANCIESWKVFMIENRHLKAYYELYKGGKIYCTEVNGKSLWQILSEYKSKNEACRVSSKDQKFKSATCTEMEIAYLVLGYFEEAKYINSYKTFKMENPYLITYPSVVEERVVNPTNAFGKSLLKILQEYCSSTGMHFCSGCINFLPNSRGDLYKTILKGIDVNLLNIVLVWQPSGRKKLDNIESHFIEFGAVKDVTSGWNVNGYFCELDYLVTYYSHESASQAEYGLPLIYSNVQAMTLRRLLLATAEIEASRDAFHAWLQLNVYGKRKAGNVIDVKTFISTYSPVTAVNVVKFYEYKSKVCYELAFRHFTHALAAEISLLGPLKELSRKKTFLFALFVQQTVAIRKILKLLKAKMSCHFQENALSFAFKQKLGLKTYCRKLPTPVHGELQRKIKSINTKQQSASFGESKNEPDTDIKSFQTKQKGNSLKMKEELEVEDMTCFAEINSNPEAQ